MEMGEEPGSGEITRLLRDLEAGDRAAFDQLLPLVYDQLRLIARRQLSREATGHTLRPTALIHEAYVKLVDVPAGGFEDRAHFFRVAARAMRQVLVEHARRRGAAKRGGEWRRTTLRPHRLGFEVDVEELLALDDALRRLERIDERLALVVEQRFFAGLTESEIADLLGVTERTVQRDWAKARAWLYKELYRDDR